MARPRRDWIPGDIYHVFCRGSNRQAIFRYDSDHFDLLECLTRVVAQYELECLEFLLMHNHCHYIFRTGEPCLSQAMKALNGRYSLRFNRRHGREAHLFRSRFGAVLQTSDEQLRSTMRYVVMNPVSAGLCAHPSEWTWSSYRATARLEPAPVFLATRVAWSFFGDTPEKAAAAYVEFVAG